MSAAPQDLCTLTDVKAWLNVTVTTDDNLLQRLLTAESTMIQSWLNRQIASQSYTETRDGSGVGDGAYEMVLANYPVTAIASLTIDGLAVPASTDNGVMQPGYGFDSHRIWLARVTNSYEERYSNAWQFTRGRGNVIITYTAGYATTPDDIYQACIELVSIRYRERDRIGQNSKSLAGETVSFNTKAMTDSILQTLNQYKKVVPV